MIIIPSCFSQPSSPSTKTNRRKDHEEDEEEGEDDQESNQSLITCIYQTHLFDSPTYLTLTWSKTLTSHTLTIHASDNSFSAATISLRPPHFSLFRPKPKSRSKTLTLNIARRNSDGKSKFRLYWDFSRAEFAARGSSAEPESRFHLAIAPSRAERLDFFLGELPEDLARRAHKLTNAPVMISRREHAFGRGRRFSSRAVISGIRREIGIVCAEGTLRVTIDGVVRLSVKRLAWKFRGNERISMGNDGSDVEFFWDVFNWVSGNGKGHGVFVFQAGDGGVWSEMAESEKKLLRKSCSSLPATEKANNNNNNNYYCNKNNNGYNTGWSKSPSWSSVLQWAEESSDGGSRSSCSSSTRSSVGNNSSVSSSNNGGFSLMLYAWRKD